MRLRSHYFILAVSIVLPIAVFCGIAIGMLQDAQHDSALERIEESASLTAQMIDADIYRAQSVLQVLANSNALPWRAPTLKPAGPTPARVVAGEMPPAPIVEHRRRVMLVEHNDDARDMMILATEAGFKHHFTKPIWLQDLQTALS